MALTPLTKIMHADVPRRSELVVNEVVMLCVVCVGLARATRRCRATRFSV